MKKIIKLTESDLQDIVSRVISERTISEQSPPTDTPVPQQPKPLQQTTYGKCTNTNDISDPLITSEIKSNKLGEPETVAFMFTTYFGSTQSSEAYKSTLLQLKKQILDKLKSGNIIGNYDLELMKVKTVIGSASNFFNGPLKPTNNQNGSEISPNKLEVEPYSSLPGDENSNWVTNKGYADSRWKNLLNYIKTNGKKIGFGVTENLPKPTKILSRITDTGGCNDEKRDISKFKNPGQFVRVIGTIKLIPIELGTGDIITLTECAQGLKIIVGYFHQSRSIEGTKIPKNSKGHECDYATFTISCNKIPVGISNMNNGSGALLGKDPKGMVGLEQSNVFRKAPKFKGDTVYSVISVGSDKLNQIIKKSKNGKIYMTIQGTPNTLKRPKTKGLHGDAPMVWAFVDDKDTGEKRTVYGPKEPFGVKAGDVSPFLRKGMGSFNPCIEITI